MANIKDEPYPISGKAGDFWSFDSPQWLERYIYIQDRVEAYFDNFRDSIDYDFTRLDETVEARQKELTLAMEQFAGGVITATAVEPKAKALREAFKRAEAPPASLLSQLRRDRKPSVDKYPLRANSMEYIKAANSRLFFAGEYPKVDGKTYAMVEGGGGYAADGSPLDQSEAERRINEELAAEFGDRLNQAVEVTYIKPRKKQEPEQEPEKDEPTLPVKETVAAIKTGGKTTDELAEERERVKWQELATPKQRKR